MRVLSRLLERSMFGLHADQRCQLCELAAWNLTSLMRWPSSSPSRCGPRAHLASPIVPTCWRLLSGRDRLEWAKELQYQSSCGRKISELRRNLANAAGTRAPIMRGDRQNSE